MGRSAVRKAIKLVGVHRVGQVAPQHGEPRIDALSATNEKSCEQVGVALRSVSMSKQACTISRMVPALDLSSDSRRTARNPAQVTGAPHTGTAGHRPLVLFAPKRHKPPTQGLPGASDKQTNRQIDKLTDKADL